MQTFGALAVIAGEIFTVAIFIGVLVYKRQLDRNSMKPEDFRNRYISWYLNSLAILFLVLGFFSHMLIPGFRPDWAPVTSLFLKISFGCFFVILGILPVFYTFRPVCSGKQPVHTAVGFRAWRRNDLVRLVVFSNGMEVINGFRTYQVIPQSVRIENGYRVIFTLDGNPDFPREINFFNPEKAQAVKEHVERLIESMAEAEGRKKPT